MGGGAMIRGVARLMGAATVGTAVMTPSSSSAFCHASTQEHLNNMSPSLNLDSSRGDVPSKTTADIRYPNADGLEYSSDEDWGKVSYNRLIFSPAPSEEEVEEATKELHAVLHLSMPASGATAEERQRTPMLEHEERELVPADMDQDKVADKPLASISAGLGLLAAGSGSVYQAFHLLQTNSNVQDAVKSLARDPAVWRAVLSNEKVQQLTQSLQEGHETAFQVKPTLRKEDAEEYNILKLTSKVCDFVTGKVLQVLDKLVEIVGSIFSSVEKAFSSKEISSNMDKTVASCMMLAVAVLLVVVVKRVGK
eukprot:c21200_g1_i1 orf=157-1083(+)